MRREELTCFKINELKNSRTREEPTVSRRGPHRSILEILLTRPRPTTEKEAFWAEFQAGVEARLCSTEADVLLRFVEVPRENLYFSRKAPG